MRGALAVMAVQVVALGQDATPPARNATAVNTIADYHTSRRTGDRDPVTRISGVCRISAGDPLETLACAAPETEEGSGRRYYYTVALFRDLDGVLYMAACASLARDSLCGEVRKGETFPAEVEGEAIRLVAAGRPLPLRILERRTPPRTIDSPTEGTPSQVKPSAGAPSQIPHSNVPESRGAPSQVRSSDASVTVGAPSSVAPSKVSTPVNSPGGSRLHLEASSGPASVYVDDQFVGYAPVALPLVPGRHIIRVAAKGFPDWVQAIRLGPGETARLQADLRR
jgi:hypothetical protein